MTKPTSLFRLHRHLSILVLLSGVCFLLVECQTEELTCRSLIVSVDEGLAANRIVTSLGDLEGTYVPLITDGRFTVFDRYFDIGRTNGILSTTREVDRDAMAVSLGNASLPVVFDVRVNVVTLVDSQLQVLECIFLTLNVVDMDDNVPIFSTTENPLRIDIREGQRTSNGIPLAVDNDEGANGTSEYILLENHGIFHLEVERLDGVTISRVILRNNVTLDAETVPSYNLTIIAREGNSDPDEAVLHVVITAEPICDEAPFFPTSSYYTTIEEESSLGTVVFSNLSAMDNDIGSGGQSSLRYYIETVCRKETVDSFCDDIRPYPFMLDLESGVLTIDGEVDREDFAEYNVLVRVQDSCQRSSTAMIVVTLEDSNDNPPMITCVPCVEEFSEATTLETLNYLTIEDPDAGENGNITVQLYERINGMLVPAEQNNNFYLFREGSTYGLNRRITFDYEQQQMYSFVINATDHGRPTPQFDLFNHTIYVLDFNDNPPEILPIAPVYEIDENTTPGTMIVKLNATDRDSPDNGNGEISFSLPPSNSSFPHQDLFSIETSTGRLLVEGELDREQHASLFVLVVASDNPRSNNELNTAAQLSTSIIVNITLNDVNDYRPDIIFPGNTFNISETHPPHTTAFTVMAVDLDTPRFSTITFSFVNSPDIFSIDPSTGVVTLERSLDYEREQNYTVTIRASDGGTEPREKSVLIMVVDENDEPPRFDFSPLMPTVLEEMDSGTHVVDVTATDPDTPQEALEFTIVAGNDRNDFRIDRNTGRIVTRRALDKESISVYNLTVRVFDGVQFALEDQYVVVTVIDVNDNPPEFIGEPYKFHIPEGMPSGTFVGRVNANDRDTGSNAVIVYSIQPDPNNVVMTSWFSIDSNSGNITTTVELDRESPEVTSQTIQLVVFARNQDFENMTRVTIQIDDIDDNGPYFLTNLTQIELAENTPTGYTFLTVMARDDDLPPNNHIVYRISNRFPPNIEQRMHIDENTGALSLITTLDYETEMRLDFIVTAQDNASRHERVEHPIRIIVTDSQECDLQFVDLPLQAYIYEGSQPDTLIATFEARDTSGNPIPPPGVRYFTTALDGMPSGYLNATIIPGTNLAELHTLVGGSNLDRETLVNQPGGATLMVNVTASIINLECTPLTSIVSVTILDINDNDPEFSSSSYRFSIHENNYIGEEVDRVTAVDPDLGLNGTVTYSIEGTVPFAISSGGVITAQSSLDREGPAEYYEFRVVASDNGTPSRTSSATVRVDILDQNDNLPVFSPTQDRTFLVREDHPVNTIIETIIVTDADAGSFGEVIVSTSNLDSHFSLAPNGSIILVLPLDRETQDEYSFVARAVDGDQRDATEGITIVVTDFNDNPPVFQDTPSSFSIPEDLGVGSVITRLIVTDDDIGVNSRIRYEVADRTYYRTFCIIQSTGEVTVCLPGDPDRCLTDIYSDIIDYERQNFYELTVLAYDEGSPRHFANKTIEITILDVNEHEPVFDSDIITVYVDEGQRVGTTVARVRAYDWDDLDLSSDELNYEVFEDNQPSTHFRYENGAIVTTQVLNYSVNMFFILRLRASEASGEFNSTAEIFVMVNNINNHRPVFSRINPVRIPETTAQGMLITTVRATDADTNAHDAISYSIIGGNSANLFSIDSLTGEVRVNRTLDFDSQPEHDLTIQAFDGVHAATERLSITLLDENDESPQFTLSEYTFTYNEYSPIGTSVGRVEAPDHDSDTRYFGNVTYSFSQDSNSNMAADNYFRVDETSGDIISLVAIDRNEFLQEHSNSDTIVFSVVASDKGVPSHSDTATVTVVITDINDHPPQFSQDRYLVNIGPSEAANSPFITLVVTDEDVGANAEASFEIVSSSLAVEISTLGELSLSQPLPPDYEKSYTITVRATDRLNRSMYSETEVLLLVEGDNDHHPVFDGQGKYTVSIPEDTPTSRSIFNADDHVSDHDTGSNGRLTFSFRRSYPNFAIGESNGVISLVQAVDYDTDSTSYTLEVLATDGNSRTSSAFVVVSVTPVNEFSPVPASDFPTQITLSPVTYIGVDLFTFRAEDGDGGQDGMVEYRLLGGDQLFSINPQSGVVRNTAALTDGTSATLVVEAYDLGEPSRCTNTSVTITIQSQGSSTPTFSSTSQTIMLLEGPGVNIGMILESFRAEGAQTYHIAKHNGSEGMFAITEVSGDLSLQQPVDYEVDTQYQLIVEARSQTVTGGHLTQRSAYLVIDVQVLDRNDETPIFDPIHSPPLVPENAPVGTVVTRVHARDDDSGSNGEVRYEIVTSPAPPFSVNSSGFITVASPLDREQASFYDIRIRAFDLSHDPLTDEVLVHIDIDDVDDSPTVYEEAYSVGVYESPQTSGGDRIIKLAARDLDRGPPLRYEIVSTAGSRMRVPVTDGVHGTFVIEIDSGLVKLRHDAKLDHTTVDKYVLHVRTYHASDASTTLASTNLTITILDVNNHDPVFSHPPSEERVFENQPVGTRVMDVFASDEDSGVNGWVTYSFGPGSPEEYFTIDSVTGVIRISRVFSFREDASLFNVTVIATDHGTPPRSATTMFNIRVRDVNDHAPQFDSSTYVIPMSINAEVDTVLHRFTTTDLDFQQNRNTRVRIPHYYDDANNHFTVEPMNGIQLFKLTRTQGLEVRNYTFRFEAVNLRPVPMCTQFDAMSYADVTVIVYPANDHCPEFQQAVYTENMMEETDPSEYQPLLMVSAIDPEMNTITYSINYTTSPFSENFDINPMTGAINLRRVVDREALTSDTHSFTVLASDDGFPSMTCSTTVTITVLDINDNVPTFEMDEYTGTIAENTPPQTVMITKVTAIDPDLDQAGIVQYEKSPVDVPFRLNSNGEIFATEEFDFETRSSYQFEVFAMNPISRSSRGTATVRINVVDENEFSPMFIDAPAGPIFIERGLTKGTPVYSVRAEDGDGGPQGVVTYSFVNEAPRDYFAINSSTGEITYTGFEQPTGDITIETSDGNPAKRQAEPENNYFPVIAEIRASDGGQSSVISIEFQLHKSYVNIDPTGAPSIPPEVLYAVVAAVVAAVITVFVVIVVCACVCRRRRHSKTGQIKDANGPMNNGMEMGRFSQYSSQRSGSSNSSSRYQTKIRGIPGHEHSRISAGSIGSNSNRESYAAYADDEMESVMGENGIYAHSLPRKSPSPTSDLASTVATEMLTGHSQEQPPYSKAQIAAIYAANREILENTGSQNSIHMFGSEGGGEGDGDMDIDTMLFTKLNDFDDDDDDDDDDDTTLPDDTSYHEHPSMSGSGGNLTIPRPVEEDEDPFPYSPSQPKWAPQMKPMEAAIDDLHELAAYPSTDPNDPPLHHHASLPYHMYDHSQSQNTPPIYEPSAHDMIPRHHMHRHHDQRLPQMNSRMPPEYGVYGTPPQEARHQMRHMMPPRQTRQAQQQRRYGSAAELSLQYPHDIPPPRFMHFHGGYSQETPLYHLPSHYVPQLNTHTPSSSTATPTEDGTGTPHMTLTNDYMDPGYNFSSSSTSLSTQP